MDELLHGSVLGVDFLFLGGRESFLTTTEPLLAATEKFLRAARIRILGVR